MVMMLLPGFFVGVIILIPMILEHILLSKVQELIGESDE